MKILVTEDEPKIAAFIKKGLEEAGHVVDLAATGNNCLELAGHFDYDLLIMDVMLPDVDGVKVVQTLRANSKSYPVLFLSALNSTQDKVKGLDSGGDDYLTKPFVFDELLARVRALTRRKSAIGEGLVLKAGNLRLNVASRQVWRGDQEVELTSKEFSILEYLLRNKGKAVSRTQLLDAVWSYNFDPGSNITDVYINMLRKKIDYEPEEKLIHTVVGVGYIVKE